jgi:chromosome partitioning protein
MKKIAILNQKGGVGKSAISVNLSYALTAFKKQTILIDLDPQGNSSGIYYSEVTKEESVSELFRDKKYDISKLIRPAMDQNGQPIEGLNVVPSNIHLAVTSESVIAWPHREKILFNHLKRVDGKCDFILIDCPPSLGILSLNAIFAADSFIIPINYDKFSLDGLADLFDILAEVRETDIFDFRIIRSIKDVRSTRTNKPIEKALEDYKESLFKTSIRRAEVVNQALMEGASVFTYSPSHPVCNEFKALAMEVIEYVE